MKFDPFSKLIPNTSPEARVSREGDRVRLQIPAGKADQYRLAQLDDCAGQARYSFHWKPPLTLHFRARASHASLPGTWGVGLWNDPFSLNLGMGGGTRRFPTIPNAAWFFFASPPNYLSFHNAPSAQGWLAQTFRAPPVPTWMFAPAGVGLPLFAWKPLSRALRPLLRRIVPHVTTQISVEVTTWHAYTLEWRKDAVTFFVDGNPILRTNIVPRPPLGLVCWVDNQYLAFPPEGGLHYGTLPTPEPAWIELEALQIG